ncbi:MAG: tRNA pseudouridine(38-40) synthase TruA [Elusimicrobia bacterium]|nr:tRNA pseudouridine(38-40) synthase TruA [Elusimicrobiota bacterium]
MKNWKLSVSYDGSKFFGSQIQKNRPTVQGFLKKAIEKTVGHKVKLTFASRTDRGVHARANFCSFQSGTKIPRENLKHAINSRLPKHIRVNKVSPAQNFDARRSAKSKIYRYFFKTRNFFPYDHDYRLFAAKQPDWAKMEAMAERIPGRKDFRHFSSCSDRKNTTAEISKCEIRKTQDGFYIEVEGSHFLYKMVRTICALILKAGMGEISPGNFEKIIKGKFRHIQPLPPNGLYLWKVKYESPTCTQVGDEK